MSRHVMIDLETLATDNNSFIMSLGAVKFSRLGIEGDRFYEAVHFPKMTSYTISPSTVAWWLGQSKDAQHALITGLGRPLKIILEEFSTWFKFGGGTVGKEVWGNGSDFDNVILRNAFEKEGIECPWKYINNRCFRTVKNLHRFTVVSHGIKHNALNDAIAQANALIDHVPELLD